MVSARALVHASWRSRKRNIDALKCDELVVVFINTGDKVQARVPLVHNLVLLVLDDIAELWSARENKRRRLACDSRTVSSSKLCVPLAQANLALPANQQKELNHCKSALKDERSK